MTASPAAGGVKFLQPTAEAVGHAPFFGQSRLPAGDTNPGEDGMQRTNPPPDADHRDLQIVAG